MLASVTESLLQSHIEAFVESMPRPYRYVFSPRGIEDHARLVAERQARPAAVGRFHSRRDLGAEAICVVADDRPGLLATISAALVVEQLDVVHAEAYTRSSGPGRNEAVDVFWVRDQRASGSSTVSDERLARLESTLVDLIEGRQTLSQVPRPRPAPNTAFQARVRFIEDDDGQLSTLEVETADRSGLLLALAEALFEQKVQIVRSEVHTEKYRVQDRFVLLELDGTAIGPDRRLEIQVAVLRAIEPVLTAS